MTRSVLFTYQWIGGACLGKCLCGWEGRPLHSTTGARELHTEHVNEDCPIGKRTTNA